MSGIVLRRSTILADAHKHGGFGPLSRDPSQSPSVVRVGSFEWPTLNDFSSPRPQHRVDRVERTARAYVGGDDSAVLKPWIVMATDFSRTKPETKTTIPVGSVVRFTVQRQHAPALWKASDDASEMAILRGKVVATRSPLLADSYAVQVTEAVSTHDLDASVAPPGVGQIFLVAPDSVGSVESIGSEAPPTLVIPSTSEFVGQIFQPTASSPPEGWTIPSLSDLTGGAAPAIVIAPAPAAPAPAPTAPVVVPSAAAGTPNSLATEPAGASGTSIAIAIGVLLVTGLGFAYWRFA